MRLKQLWRKILDIGIIESYSQAKAKRIRLTNGFALITGLISISSSITSIIFNFATTGEIKTMGLAGPIGITFGFFALIPIVINHYKKHIFASYLILSIWWLLLTSFIIIYGEAVRFDRYLIVEMVIPMAMFAKKRDIILSTSFSVLLFLSAQVLYELHPPLIETEASFAPYRYAIHTIFMIITLLGSLVYFKVQNDRNEKLILEEVKIRRRTEAELKEANYAKDRFFSVIAHDLKGSVGNIALILNKFEKERIPPKLFEHLKISAQNTYELLQDLLSWARSQKKLIKYLPVHFNLFDLVDQTAKVFTLAIQQKELELLIINNSKDIYAHADQASIKTIVRNLLSNAIKYSYKGGVVKLVLDSNDEYVTVSIQDYGIGISKSKIETLFNIDENTRSSPGTFNEIGTGLGLILCNEFVEANKGRLFVESDENKGTCFWFTIPRGKEYSQTKLVNRLKEMQLKFLIVEDDYLDLQTTLSVLQKLQINGISFVNAEDAITAYESEQPDIILIDIELPNMDGVDATWYIKDQYPNQLVYALTSFEPSFAKEKYGNNLPFDAFLRKPLEEEELLNYLGHDLDW